MEAFHSVSSDRHLLLATCWLWTTYVVVISSLWIETRKIENMETYGFWQQKKASLPAEKDRCSALEGSQLDCQREQSEPAEAQPCCVHEEEKEGDSYLRSYQDTSSKLVYLLQLEVYFLLGT